MKKAMMLFALYIRRPRSVLPQYLYFIGFFILFQPCLPDPFLLHISLHYRQIVFFNPQLIKKARKDEKL